MKKNRQTKPFEGKINQLKRENAERIDQAIKLCEEILNK